MCLCRTVRSEAVNGPQKVESGSIFSSQVLSARDRHRIVMAQLCVALARLRPLTAATTTLLVLRMSEEQEGQEEQDEEQLRQAINVGFDTISWAFAPLILLLGLSLAFATGRGADGAPIRIGAPRGADPLSFSAPPRATLEGPAGRHTAARALAATTSPAPLTDIPALHGSLLLSLVAMAPDDVLRDLQEEPSVKALSLPQAEQAKQRAMEELEDDRLERCRSAAAFEFDQCFFFGPSGTTAARRPMEGAGTHCLSCTRCRCRCGYADVGVDADADVDVDVDVDVMRMHGHMHISLVRSCGALCGRLAPPYAERAKNRTACFVPAPTRRWPSTQGADVVRVAIRLSSARRSADTGYSGLP